MSDLIDSRHDTDKAEEERKQNDLLARREARRRRILENAKSRLDKLSGSNGNSAAHRTTNSHTEIYSNPEIDHPEVIDFLHVPIYTTTPNEGIHNDTAWESTPLVQTPAVKPPNRLEKYLNKRVHIVAASTVTYALLVLGVDAFISQSLFIFFLIAECFELLIFHSEKPLNPIVEMALLLSGLNISTVGVLIKVLGLIQKILTDFGLFVFCFVMSHGIYCLFVKGEGDQIFASF